MNSSFKTNSDIFQKYIGSYWPKFERILRRETREKWERYISLHFMPRIRHAPAPGALGYAHKIDEYFIAVKQDSSYVRSTAYMFKETFTFAIQDVIMQRLQQKAFYLERCLRRCHRPIFQSSCIEDRFYAELFRKKRTYSSGLINSPQNVITLAYEPLNKIFQTTYYDYVNSCHFSLLKMKRNININSEMIEQTAFNLNES